MHNYNTLALTQQIYHDFSITMDQVKNEWKIKPYKV